MLLLYNPIATERRHATVPMSLLALGSALEGRYEYAIVDGHVYDDPEAELLTRLRDPVLRSLRDSSIAFEALDEIVLVGGATRMPLVRKAVTRMFGRFPSASVNPDEAVARGAAVQAALKSRDADLREVVLTDVCPYTLGVASAEKHAGGRRSAQPLPAGHQRFHTYHPERRSRDKQSGQAGWDQLFRKHQATIAGSEDQHAVECAPPQLTTFRQVHSR